MPSASLGTAATDAAVVGPVATANVRTPSIGRKSADPLPSSASWMGATALGVSVPAARRSAGSRSNTVRRATCVVEPGGVTRTSSHSAVASPSTGPAGSAGRLRAEQVGAVAGREGDAAVRHEGLAPDEQRRSVLDPTLPEQVAQRVAQRLEAGRLALRERHGRLRERIRVAVVGEDLVRRELSAGHALHEHPELDLDCAGRRVARRASPWAGSGRHPAASPPRWGRGRPSVVPFAICTQV